MDATSAALSSRLIRETYLSRIHIVISSLIYGPGFYVLAKASETYDHKLFSPAGETLSGHMIKHILAALAALSLYRMPVNRTISNDS